MMIEILYGVSILMSNHGASTEQRVSPIDRPIPVLCHLSQTCYVVSLKFTNINSEL